MAVNKVLIDTNIYSDALRGLPEAMQVLKTADQLLMSPIVIAELFAGFKLDAKESQNKKQLKKFFATPRVVLISITDETADFYSFLFTQLRKSCAPIPTNDIWIAASTMEHGAKLATNDTHFQKINGLYLQ